MRIRTGTDIIEISRVKESIESTNKKYPRKPGTPAKQPL